MGSETRNSEFAKPEFSYELRALTKTDLQIPAGKLLNVISFCHLNLEYLGFFFKYSQLITLTCIITGKCR